jgi:hypothetical protein
MDLREISVGSGLDEYGYGKEPVATSCEHGNENSGSIKVDKFLTS